jgi:hypothetical protein
MDLTSPAARTRQFYTAPVGNRLGSQVVVYELASLAYAKSRAPTCSATKVQRLDLDLFRLEPLAQVLDDLLLVFQAAPRNRHAHVKRLSLLSQDVSRAFQDGQAAPASPSRSLCVVDIHRTIAGKPNKVKAPGKPSCLLF